MDITEQNLKADDILKQIFGYSSYRNGQEEIVKNILDGKQTLAIMPTGAGKSLCYQIPAIASELKTVVISPLISLIENQVADLRENGVKVEKLHSNQSSQNREISWNNFANGECKILYISPERLMTETMINDLKQLEIGLFVVDEIHCVSKWGQSFRPDYEALSKLKTIFKNSNIAGFTATADKTTRLDILDKIFNQEAKTFIKGFDRPNLSLSIVQKTNWKSQIIEFISDRKFQPGIIYCISRNKTEEVATFLNQNGYKASAYHAGLDGATRDKIQNIFMTEPYHIIVATIAFGMGIDKPDIRFVINLGIPDSIESYYQQIGRAGRDNKPSDTLVIYGLDDLVTRRRMIEQNDNNNEYKLLENKRLDYLLSLCETPECRRKVLLAYFDETLEKCDNCDNCHNPPLLIDGTILAQKLMSTIYRTGQYFGQAHIINVIRGSEDKKIIDRKHNNLSVYGIGKDRSKEFWQSFLRQLLASGHLRINFQKFSAIELTSLGVEVLKNKQKFMFKEIILKGEKKLVRKESKQFDELTENEISLLNELKSLRLKIAKTQNLPAFTVFHDSTLKQMSHLKPKNEIEMLKVDGVGETKLKKYGKAFLEAINKKAE